MAKTALALSAFAALAFGASPLAFERGPGEAQVVSRGPYHTLLLKPDGAVLRAAGSTVKMSLVGADPNAQAILLDPLDTRVHYLLGSPDHWETDVPTYARVEFRNIYPGIHLAFHGAESDQPVTGQLEYDFLLDPGADPSRIRLRFEGPQSMRLDLNGDLLLRNSSAEWRHTAPSAWQGRAGARKAVETRLVAAGPDEFTVELAPYDSSQPLVIDPVLSYSTFLGGSGHDNATSIAIDSSGNAYVAGYTTSLDFPEVSGFKYGRPSGVDAFVAKLSPSGQLVYLAYLGGSGDDRAYGIAVDGSGSAVITGWTYSSDFPILNAVQPALGGGEDAFAAKLNPAGNGLVFSTFLGGAGADCANAVAVDQQSNIYVAGQTASANFPILNGLQRQLAGGMDAFIEKFSSSGARLYGTYLGGVADDRATAIAVDVSGNAYITGSTYSPNFPTVSAFQPTLGGGQDAFVAKLNSTGTALIYSTYLGGSGGTVSAPETGTGIAVDSYGYAYVTGTTSSPNFPLSLPLQASPQSLQTAFVTKLGVSGNALVYSTYLGGSGPTEANAIAVDSTGQAYVAGYTASTDFPTSSAVQYANAGGYDAFVAQFTAAGTALNFSTYLGGSGDDTSNGIALDSSGNIYLAGQTQSMMFPTAAPIQVYALSSMSTWFARIATAPGNISLTNMIIASGTSTYQAINSITFIGVTINAAASVQVTAGSCIKLEPEFRATAGSAPITFHAAIAL